MGGDPRTMAGPSPPRLTFACELPPEKLADLLAPGATLRAPTVLGARVALTVPHLSAGRAAAVRRLNDAGVPAVAVLLVAPEQGYFLNLDNAAAAARRYDEFHSWTADNALEWDAVALDLEPPAEELSAFFVSGDRLALLRRAMARVLDRERLRRGTEMYAQLVERMRIDGFAVESFQFPFVVEDRKARSSLVHRLMSVPEVGTDRDTLMIYTSFQRRFGPALLASYGRDAEAIALGSTGGGAEEASGDVTLPTLGWEELAGDLRLARRFTDHITIHSLEGCASTQMLERLEVFDWDGPVPDPGASAMAVAAVRGVLRAILRSASHPYVSAAALGAVMATALRGRARR